MVEPVLCTCKRCKYKWVFRGRLGYGCCPNCNYRQILRDPTYIPDTIINTVNLNVTIK